MKELTKSGVAGVVWNKRSKRWISSINIDKKHLHLGSFKDLTEAVLKRYRAEQAMDRELYIGYSPAHWYLINNGYIKHNN